MAITLGNCVRSCWLFMVGLLELNLYILIIGLSLSYLVAAAVLVAKCHLLNSLQMTSSYADYINAIGLISIVILGIYGLYNKQLSAIRLFVIGAVFNGYYWSNKFDNTYTIRIIDIESDPSYRFFLELMHNYNSSGTSYNAGTLFVDGIQALGCCGYNGYKDWLMLSPPGHEQLPSSCCFPQTSLMNYKPTICNIDYVLDHKTEGCYRTIRGIELMLYILNNLNLWFLILLIIVLL